VAQGRLVIAIIWPRVIEHGAWGRREGVAYSLLAALSALGIVLRPLVIPWPYVFANCMRKPGDRWRRAAASAV